MTEKQQIFDQMAESIVEYDDETAYKLAKQAIDLKMDLLEVIEEGFGKGIRKVGDLYDEGEYYLPELMACADIMQEAIKILKPHLLQQEMKSAGVVIMATIEGDIHSIGKDIVATILSANGFEVIDLGADVAIETIIDKAIETKAQLIGVSTLLTTTMDGQKRLVEKLTKRGIRKDFKVMLGGAVVSKQWVEECEADGYASNAFEAVKVAKSVLL